MKGLYNSRMYATDMSYTESLASARNIQTLKKDENEKQIQIELLHKKDMMDLRFCEFDFGDAFED